MLPSLYGGHEMPFGYTLLALVVVIAQRSRVDGEPDLWFLPKLPCCSVLMLVIDTLCA